MKSQTADAKHLY